MSEATFVDSQIFEPNAGGLGVRFAVTTVSSTVRIPRSTESWDRVLISNGGLVSAYCRIGQASVTADTNCLEVLPGTQALYRLPFVAPDTPWIAAVTEVAATTTKLSVILGKGI